MFDPYPIKNASRRTVRSTILLNFCMKWARQTCPPVSQILTSSLLVLTLKFVKFISFGKFCQLEFKLVKIVDNCSRMENISADQSFVLINLQLHYLSLSLKFICINFPFICICNLITRNMVIVFNSWGPPYFPSTLSRMFQFRVRSLSAVTLAKLKLDFELVEIVDNCSRMDNILNHVIH